MFSSDFRNFQTQQCLLTVAGRCELVEVTEKA
jgi:hypothetical protein